jgi:hypothetical protein
MEVQCEVAEKALEFGAAEGRPINLVLDQVFVATDRTPSKHTTALLAQERHGIFVYRRPG